MRGKPEEICMMLWKGMSMKENATFTERYVNTWGQL